MASVRRGSELEDRDLIVAALQRALAALLQAPLDPVQSGANVPFETESQRDFMCPDLYRATVSGCIDHVNRLVGLIKETTSIHDGAHDVAVSLEDSSERNGSSRQWGCRLHGDSLCMLQEVTVEKNTVLHIAAEQGHVALVQQIIRRDQTLLIYENSRHETPLHLAARTGNCLIVSHIVFLAQEYGIGAHEILTKRNKDGDTVLHEASRHGYDDVVHAGSTATLSSYGATFSPQRPDKMKTSKDETTKWIDRTFKNLIVVSVLIATIAFSAAFNVPGSYNGDGLANLRRKRQYKMFLVLDTIAMSTSLSATVVLVLTKAVNKRGSWYSFVYSLFFLWISLSTMELAFVEAVTVVLGRGKFATRSTIFCVSSLFFIGNAVILLIYIPPAKLETMMKFLGTIKKQSQTTSRIANQLLMVVSYIVGVFWFIFLNLIFFFVLELVFLLFDYNDLSLQLNGDV